MALTYALPKVNIINDINEIFKFQSKFFPVFYLVFNITIMILIEIKMIWMSEHMLAVLFTKQRSPYIPATSHTYILFCYKDAYRMQ